MFKTFFVNDHKVDTFNEAHVVQTSSVSRKLI